MSKTGFWGETAPIANATTPISPEIRMATWGRRGGVGVYSTAYDLFLWQNALFSGNILSKPSREKLFAPNSTTSKGTHGYGWFVSEKAGVRIYWTAGYEGFGHNGFVKVYSDGTVVIVLSNAGDIDGRPARDAVGDGLESLIFGSP